MAISGETRPWKTPSSFGLNLASACKYKVPKQLGTTSPYSGNHPIADVIAQNKWAWLWGITLQSSFSKSSKNSLEQYADEVAAKGTLPHVQSWDVLVLCETHEMTSNV
jgi:hypothetical protein